MKAIQLHAFRNERGELVYLDSAGNAYMQSGINGQLGFLKKIGNIFRKKEGGSKVGNFFRKVFKKPVKATIQAVDPANPQSPQSIILQTQTPQVDPGKTIQPVNVSENTNVTIPPNGNNKKKALLIGAGVLTVTGLGIWLASQAKKGESTRAQRGA